MNNMETFNAISTHINIDILKTFDKAQSMNVKAVDLLPIVAAPIFYLDDNEDLSKRAPVFSAVRVLKKKKALPYMQFSKEALIDALLYRWVVNLEESEIERLLTGIRVIAGFDSEGNVLLDESRSAVYKDFEKTHNYKPLAYSGDKCFNPSDNENLAVIHKLLDYPPFYGVRVWSWKCETDDYKDGYPDELCCVGHNEWFDRSLRDIETFEQFKSLRGDEGKKGSVTRAWWDFANTIKAGDIVVYRDWRTDIIAGVGVFEGDYMYKPEKKNYRSCRKVNWVSIKHYPSPTHIGDGNTSPMEIDNLKVLKDLMPIIVDAMTEGDLRNTNSK